ncbi:MAG: sulfate ABC transporter ATP-binding protein [Kiritimatiellae bacterium]|nr:sulfate ABC transporter ATP-binding protein [Kiritimatiellia bacterium]
MSIEIKHINKHFGDFHALHDVSLTIPTGKLVAILGPSGCGKTTLLRIVAGLESADADGGDVLFDGESTIATPVNRRRVGFVFQHYALFRQMTVAENVAFGLTVKPKADRPSKAEIKAKVEELLDLVQLSHLGARYLDELSGGQRQRVALARALAIAPKVLLLDEPFGALDAQVRASLRRWLRHLHDTINVTSIFVTHDQEEALEVADQVVVMNKGRLEQSGSPNELFTQPKSEFVMNFLGEVNIFHGRFENGQAVFGAKAAADSAHAKMLVRPHDFKIARTPEAGGISAQVVRVLTAGSIVKIELSDDTKQTLYVHQSHAEFDKNPVKADEQVWLIPTSQRIFRNGEDWNGDYII